MRRGGMVVAVAVRLVALGMTAGVLGTQAGGPAREADPSRSSYISVNEEDFRTVLGLQLTPAEKGDLVAFLRAL